MHTAHACPEGRGPGRDAETGKAVLNEFQLAVRSSKTEPPRARFIRIELPGTQRVLSLAEVQIFDGSQNVATKGKTTQSSTDGGGEASRAIDSDSDQILHSWKAHDGWIYSLAVSPDGRMLASGGAGGQVKGWEAQTGKLIVSG